MTLAMFANNYPLIGAAILVAVLGVGRVARLITYDDYPPTIAIRSWWNRLTRGNGWAKLAFCQWCLTPWIMLFCLAWFFLAAIYAPIWVVVWFAFWGWLGISYLTSMIVRRDEPEE